jgi:hypothetical protein
LEISCSLLTFFRTPTVRMHYLSTSSSVKVAIVSIEGRCSIVRDKM